MVHDKWVVNFKGAADQAKRKYKNVKAANATAADKYKSIYKYLTKKAKKNPFVMPTFRIGGRRRTRRQSRA